MTTAAALPDLAAALETWSRFRRGGAFVLDASACIPALWGADSAVIWAQGEALTICGPAGVGKTTLAGQIVRARLVGGEVLGHRVAATTSRVLYLAMDRPSQIARAMRRHMLDVPRDALDERLVFWEGPPLADLARDTNLMLGMASHVGADTIVVDSIKDAAVGLTDDEVGAGYNRARQLCLANGVEVLELHHMVKRGANGTRPNTLADVYGSVWLTSGAGSIVLLWGAAGDPIVEWAHLKQPAEEVGPYKVIHDHEAGTSSIWHATDLLSIAQLAGDKGVTAKAAACALFSTAHPSQAEVEKARRRLRALANAGTLSELQGDDAAQRPTVWTLTNTLTAPPGSVTPHGSVQASRSRGDEHGKSLTQTLTTLTGLDPHVSPPLFRGGERGSCQCQVCDEPLDYRLIDAGETTHPGCAA